MRRCWAWATWTTPDVGRRGAIAAGDRRGVGVLAAATGGRRLPGAVGLRTRPAEDAGAATFSCGSMLGAHPVCTNRSTCATAVIAPIPVRGEAGTTRSGTGSRTTRRSATAPSAAPARSASIPGSTRRRPTTASWREVPSGGRAGLGLLRSADSQGLGHRRRPVETLEAPPHDPRFGRSLHADSAVPSHRSCYDAPRASTHRMRDEHRNLRRCAGGPGARACPGCRRYSALDRAVGFAAEPGAGVAGNAGHAAAIPDFEFDSARDGVPCTACNSAAGQLAPRLLRQRQQPLGRRMSTSRPVSSFPPTATASGRDERRGRDRLRQRPGVDVLERRLRASSTPSARRRATRRTATTAVDRPGHPGQRHLDDHHLAEQPRAGFAGGDARPRPTPIRASTTSPRRQDRLVHAQALGTRDRDPAAAQLACRTATPAAGCRARARSCSRATTRTIRRSCAIRCTPTTPTAGELEQLTFNPQGVVGGMMWRAPEFKNEYVFFTMAKDRRQILVYRKIPGADKVLRWTIVKTIDASGRPALLLLARGLHPQRPLVHLRRGELEPRRSSIARSRTSSRSAASIRCARTRGC